MAAAEAASGHGGGVRISVAVVLIRRRIEAREKSVERGVMVDEGGDTVGAIFDE